MFSSETYTDRRDRLKDQVGSGLVLIMGNDDSPMNYPDNQYPFRQDSSFLYFFGLDHPGLAGVIDIDGDREIIFGDDISIDDIIWMGPQPAVSERALEAGVLETLPVCELEGVLQKASQQGKAIHYLPQYRGCNILKLQGLLGIGSGQIAEQASVDLIKAVVEQRSKKIAEEVTEIEAALETCYKMQTTAMKATQAGLLERHVAGLMEGVVVSSGARLSFPTIFTVHGETLHNHYHGNMMKDGDIVINDSGAESALHYGGDITRTIPVSGSFTERQKDIYNIVLNSQTAAINAIMPGVPFREIHLLACEILASGLKDMGLMKGDVKEAVNAGAHALFFQCGLGHMMGLDIHDMEGLGEDYVGYTESIKRNPQFGLRSLRLGKALEVDYVITVEPGIYLIPQLIDLWKSEKKFDQFIDYNEVEKFRDFGGVRLEDDVLIADGGCRVLGKPIPRTIEEVESACLK